MPLRDPYQRRRRPTNSPPYLSLIKGEEGPVLLLTVTPEALQVCTECPHLHVRIVNLIATRAVLEGVARQILALADHDL